MQLTPEQADKCLTVGAASAVKVMREDHDRICGQINAGLGVNQVKKVTYTIDMKVIVTVDVEKHKVEVEGKYRATTPNLGKSDGKIELDLDDPNQPALFDNTEGKEEPEKEIEIVEV